MSRKGVQSTMPASELQWRARKIAMQASNLADRARPMTRSAALTARRRADIAAGWARPRVYSARGWMAGRAARGSVSMQETIGPRVAAMLATAARRLEPPKRRTRMMPPMLAGMALLLAGAAAVAAVSIRNRNAMRAMAMPPRAASGPADQSAMPSPEGEQARRAEQAGREADVDGLSQTR
jgi:hypothetical protein